MHKVCIVLFVSLSAGLAAQAPSFEVASIKQADSQLRPLRITASIGPDGIDFSNVTPQLCVQRAYGLKPYQVVGPDWIRDTRYYIVAKAGKAVPEREILLMLQSLLAERFHLTTHSETKEMDVYALTVGSKGPKLKPAADDGPTQIGPDGKEILFQRVSMPQLGGSIARSVDRPVIDATGLKGLYTFRLAWTDDLAAGRGAENQPGPGDPPSIFTALQEQLGLKLERRKAPMNILVIDHIERPSEN